MSVSTMTLSAEQANAGLAALESTLQFVLEGASVPLLAQQIVGHLGYRSLALFSRSAGSETEFRQFIKDDMLIDPSTGGQARLASAALLVAWEASRKRVEKRMDEEATQRSSDGLPRPLLKRDFLESRRAYESFRRSTDPDFVLEDKNMPSKGYLELLLERVEDGDLRPETLAEVLTADRDTDDPWGVVRTGADGLMRLQKTRASGTPPTGPEELRRRYRIMATAWQCIFFRLPHVAFLKDFREPAFDRLLEFLLGDQVHGYACESVEGLRHQCSWAQLLAYEFQLRRRAFRAVDEGSTLVQALLIAVSCERTRRQHFETPMTMSAGAAMASRGRQSRSDEASGSRAPPVRKTATKSVTKGGGRGRAKAASKGPSIDSAGERICFRFQKGKCTVANCQFKHSCQRCGATSHGASKCPQKAA